VQYNITPDLQLEVGGRLEQNWAHLRQINNLYGAVGDPPVPLFHASSTDDENRWSGSMWTGKVGVNYTLDDNNFLYAFASKGSKVGGASIGYTFKPETVMDYEAGWKSTLLDGGLVVQLAGFYSQYSNFQVDGLNPVNGLNSTFNVTEATTFSGIEAQVFGTFGHLRFDAGASWVESSVGAVTLVNTSDPVLAADITAHAFTGGLGPQCATGLPSNPPVCYNYTPYLLSMSGKRNPYAPTWNFNAGVEYTFELGGDTTLTPRIDYSLQSGQWTTLWEIPSSDWIDGHDLWNLRATLNHGQWSLSTYITNLADTTFITGQFLSTAYLNAPRQYGARLSYRF
jgi:iron complex outermembrane recepter protein